MELPASLHLLTKQRKNNPMKKPHLLIAFLTMTAITLQMQAQKSYRSAIFQKHFIASSLAAEALPANKLEGRWIRSYNDATADKLIYTLKKDDEMRWGNYLEFLPQNQIAKGYSAPCGNDTNIHRYDGSYKVQLNTIMIDLGKKGTLSYRIIKQSKDELVLQPLN
jgi:hypothetical protein